MRAAAALRALVALLLLAALQAPLRVEAHASLVSSEPPDGASLAVAPGRLRLAFDEAVEPLQLTLVGPGGRRVGLGPARIEGTAVVSEPTQALAAGTYLLSYRVISADSHPVGGSIRFGVGEAPDSPAATAASEAAAPRASPASIALRAARDAALLLAAGAALFAAGLEPFPGERRLLTCAAALAALLTLAGIEAQSRLMQGAGAAFGAWGATLGSSYGTSSIVALIGSALVAGAGIARNGRTRTAALVAGACVCIASLPLTGHAAAATPRWLAGPALAAHAFAAAFWLGSLFGLFALLRNGHPRALAALQRFSRFGSAAVALLLIAGAGFAALQLRSPDMLPGSAYGRLILLKAALLAALLVLAATNRFVLVPHLARGAPGAGSRLQATIAGEIALVLAVLMATAWLVQTAPRADAVQRELASQGYRAALRIDPAQPGENRIELVLTDAQGQPLAAPEASIEFSNAAASIEAIVRPLQRSAPGRFEHRGRELAFGGTWTIVVRARVDDFREVRWSADVEIRR